MKTEYGILETLADIAYYAGENSFFSGDSRADASNFINWAKEFEKKYKNEDWHTHDYILTIQEFARLKMAS